MSTSSRLFVASLSVRRALVVVGWCGLPTLPDRELWRVTADGELVGDMPSVENVLRRVLELEAEVADLERDMRRARARERLLLGQLEEDRQGYDRRGEVESVFDEWRQACGHRNARLTNDRFDAIRRLLEVTKPAAYPREAFTAAIAGAAYDPWTKRRRNGSEQRFDDAALIFRDGKTFESFIKRAPGGNP